jgi:hypothetical protein
MVAENAKFKFKFPARVLRCGAYVQPIHWSDDPAHDEAWADNMAARYGGRDSPGWLREHEMRPVAAGQRIWPTMSKDVHLEARPWAEIVGPEYARYRVIDHGIRHPTCCIWVAVNSRGDRYIYRQFYATDRTIAENCIAIIDATEDEEQIVGNIADPSIWSRNPVTGQAFAGVYEENGLLLEQADNRGAGYDAVSTMLVAALARWSIFNHTPHRSFGPSVSADTLEALASKPVLVFHPAVAVGVQSIYEECFNLRYQEVRGDPAQHAQPQKPVDVNDEGADVTRYACQTVLNYVPPPPPKRMVDFMRERARRRKETTLV